MTTRNVSKQASALARARERRRTLDRERDEHDRRVEEATAAALLAWEMRGEVLRELDGVTERFGDALRALMGEGVSVERASALLELDVTEMRRLAKTAASAGTSSKEAKSAPASVATLPSAAGGASAARRAG
jgi:DNA-directed RNA polymerase specialized sigma24 family protein